MRLPAVPRLLTGSSLRAAAAVLGLVGTCASVAGNELAIKFGRRLLIAGVHNNVPFDRERARILGW